MNFFDCCICLELFAYPEKTGLLKTGMPPFSSINLHLFLMLSLSVAFIYLPQTWTSVSTMAFVTSFARMINLDILVVVLKDID